jgi:hypothetical protein
MLYSQNQASDYYRCGETTHNQQWSHNARKQAQKRMAPQRCFVSIG